MENIGTDKISWMEKRLKCLEEIAYASHDNLEKLGGRVSLLEKREGETEITFLDVVKQLNLDIFSSAVYAVAGMSKSEAEFRARLRKRLTEKELQAYDLAAQHDGNQPLSFSGRQK